MITTEFPTCSAPARVELLFRFLVEEVDMPCVVDAAELVPAGGALSDVGQARIQCCEQGTIDGVM